MSVRSLLGAVDDAFASTAQGLTPWPDPHPGGHGPSDDEYSRVTNAERWRIVGARADAWLVVISEAGLGTVERETAVQWVAEPGTGIVRTDRAVPNRIGALPLVIARSGVGDVPDAGVTFGVGDPATCVAWLPDCGCDACDSGSKNELDQVDRIIVGVISGTFRRLTSRGRQITQFDSDGWSASGRFARGEVERVLANPSGWHQLSGPGWIDTA